MISKVLSSAVAWIFKLIKYTKHSGVFNREGV